MRARSRESSGNADSGLGSGGIGSGGGIGRAAECDSGGISQRVGLQHLRHAYWFFVILAIGSGWGADIHKLGVDIPVLPVLVGDVVCIVVCRMSHVLGCPVRKRQTCALVTPKSLECPSGNV